MQNHTEEMKKRWSVCAAHTFVSDVHLGALDNHFPTLAIVYQGLKRLRYYRLKLSRYSRDEALFAHVSELPPSSAGTIANVPLKRKQRGNPRRRLLPHGTEVE
jgi:hypothetical protein